MRKGFYQVLLILCIVPLILDGWAILDFILHPLAPVNIYYPPIYRAITILIPLPLTLLVGFLIIRRVPGNIVGPLLILWSASVAYQAIREDIGLIPFTLFYFYNMAFGWFAFFCMFLYFPDGKIYPPRAVPWIYASIWINIITLPPTILTIPYFETAARIPNPIFIPSLLPYSDSLLIFGLLLFSPVIVMTSISPVLRYRKGSPLERQQIKWLALFGGSIALYTILGLVAYPLLVGEPVMNPGYNVFGMLFFILTGLFPPVAIGVSILRYRLWDIDRIIRRTLVYSILTVVLTMIYFGSVLLLRNILAFFFSLNSSDLAVVISTLAIAALFTPLRRRIQTQIDRRFYRQRYDAEKILASFATTAREEVTLEPLAQSLLSNVEATLQPEQMSLWLKRPSKDYQYSMITIGQATTVSEQTQTS